MDLERAWRLRPLPATVLYISLSLAVVQEKTSKAVDRVIRIYLRQVLRAGLEAIISTD